MLIAALMALGVYAVPAVASADPHGQHPDGGGHHCDGSDAGSDESGQCDEGGTVTDAGTVESDATTASNVPLRRNAIFTCFGASGGTNTADTANITANLTTITAMVTVHSAPGTIINGQLTQSGCFRLKFFTFSIPASGVRTFTVTDLRVSNDAFVWINTTTGAFEITPEVLFTRFGTASTSGQDNTDEE